MTDEPEDPKPAAAPKPKHRRRNVVSTVKELAPFAGIAVVWCGMAFVPGISDAGKTEGHALLLLFAGLIQATKRNPNDA